MEFSDADLVKQCLHGDNSAFDSLVRRYQRQVYSFCYRMLGDVEEAADAAQESFVKAYHALKRFRSDASFLTWILKIASNACIDLSRKRTRHQTTSLDSNVPEKCKLPLSDTSPESQTMQGEVERMVQEAVVHLPEKYHAPAVMFYFNGMSVKEISRTLGRPEGTVKSDLHIAREMLRQRLEGVLIDA